MSSSTFFCNHYIERNTTAIMRWFHTYKDWLWFSRMKTTSDQIFTPYKLNTFNIIIYLSMTISHLLLPGLLLFIDWPEGINHSHTFLLSTCSQLFVLMHVYNLPHYTCLIQFLRGFCLQYSTLSVILTTWVLTNSLEQVRSRKRKKIIK